MFQKIIHDTTANALTNDLNNTGQKWLQGHIITPILCDQMDDGHIF